MVVIPKFIVLNFRPGLVHVQSLSNQKMIPAQTFLVEYRRKRRDGEKKRPFFSPHLSNGRFSFSRTDIETLRVCNIIYKYKRIFS